MTKRKPEAQSREPKKHWCARCQQNVTGTEHIKWNGQAWVLCQ